MTWFVYQAGIIGNWNYILSKQDANKKITPNNNVVNVAIGIYFSGIYSRYYFVKAVYL